MPALSWRGHRLSEGGSDKFVGTQPQHLADITVFPVDIWHFKAYVPRPREHECSDIWVREQHEWVNATRARNERQTIERLCADRRRMPSAWEGSCLKAGPA